MAPEFIIVETFCISGNSIFKNSHLGYPYYVLAISYGKCLATQVSKSN